MEDNIKMDLYEVRWKGMDLIDLGQDRSEDHRGTMVKMLYYKSEGRWFDPSWCLWNFDIKSFRSHYGPGVDSASNRNEYREYFLRVKAASA